ncbi:Outer arm dynein light chain 1 protein putative isoform 1 [Tripterygium wilfordii]|uniref:Outer arm dynein light chain 1 protein putative isoform 1 n=1 Tax=Tripterygium wilfordii TaxID=458696 RepID=A0A7J7DKA8_TRIWF|nr:uncharacterized protein LOC120000266 [Tripterygium wilfordii]XP_038704175.1 uncharacterized protein LOC120000266 [Tripterygium wilfordii]KAF5746800.1 Outer arm dynein light chain 1 protein putative isoform 1 [Tripterygium wilfordii]
MAKLGCLYVLIGRKKKDKEDTSYSKSIDFNKGLRSLQIRFESSMKPSESDELKSNSVSISEPLQKNYRPDTKVKRPENLDSNEVEVAYEGEDEHEENNSIKRELSDLDLQAHVANSGDLDSPQKFAELNCSNSFDTQMNELAVKRAGGDFTERMQSGHISDPGIGQAEFWAQPKLKRSCSNLETSNVLQKIGELPPSKSQSFEKLQALSKSVRRQVYPNSPASVISHCSADRVMLKKHSSSQILPSRSRRLWWKLFLWSHRNLHKPCTQRVRPVAVSAALNQQGGYSSDTLELNQAMASSKIESPGSFTGQSFKEGCSKGHDNQSWDGFHGGNSGLWPQNQWVAFPMESSSFARVDKWVKDLETEPQPPPDGDDNHDEDIVFPPSPENGRSPRTTLLARRSEINLSEEIVYANSVIQSLNSSSSVAHISGIGLKAVPMIAGFYSLRTVNLSNNSIVHITPGTLPKGLHVLNLCRNKISTIEGLRDLTRLRALDLSYNRISRIGQGLSNCSPIKELYLAGNKISDVEGLHRLLKLTVVDLSFNKITTTKTLGQLVANHNSLLALNLLGNPIQGNIGDEQLRKAVCGLLPKLVYLNKQPIKPQRAREVFTDSIAKAALGNSGLSSRRKAAKRASMVLSPSSSGRSRSSIGAAQKSRSRSKSRVHQQLNRAAGASSSHQ